MATILTGVFAVRDSPDPATADCASPSAVVVSVAPEMESVVTGAVEQLAGDGCASYEVVGEAPAITAQAVALDDGPPDLWIPDSTIWPTRVASQRAEGAPTPTTVVRSVATTPVVLAWPDGVGQPPTSWLHVLTATNFTAGDPLASSSAATPLLAAYAEAARGVTPVAFSTVSAAQVTLAQRQSASPPSADPGALLAAVAKSGGFTVVSEQAFNAHADVAGGFKPVLPAESTIALTYPLLALSEDESTRSAAEHLGEALASAASREALAEAGFRDPLGDPLPTGASVGDFQAMTIQDSKVVTDTIKRWSLIAMPARALAVVDVSRTMRGRVGGETKMSLIVQAALKGLDLMPDSWSLGSWAFASEVQGKKDWRQLGGIRKFSSKDGAGTHRQRIVRETRRLRATKGNNSLYDTVLAAYRTVQAQYDPKSVNSVIILTGGHNDDPDGITQSQLLATLQRERDPARPVVVVAIGITRDADAFALQKIAEATGGQVYLANEPDEISDVFINALQQRY